MTDYCHLHCCYYCYCHSVCADERPDAHLVRSEAEGGEGGEVGLAAGEGAFLSLLLYTLLSTITRRSHRSQFCTTHNQTSCNELTMGRA